MITLLLDAGALIALDRNDRSVWAMLRNTTDDSAEVSVPAGVIARAWRDGNRQTLLARALATLRSTELRRVSQFVILEPWRRRSRFDLTKRQSGRSRRSRLPG